MEEQDPEVLNAAYILCSFKSKETAPKPKSPPEPMISLPRAAAARKIKKETVAKSPPRMMSLPPAGRKNRRSTKKSRSCVGWIAAMDAANIVAQKTAEVLAAAQEAEDSPLNFLLTAADATVEKARQDEAERTASMEEKKTKKARRRRREEAERSATTEEKQKLRKDREEQLKRKKEERLASFRRHQLRCESLKTSAPTCATSASVVADGEKPRPQELPRTAPPSSSSSSSLQPSQGVNFLFDLNLPPPPLLTSESRS